MFNIMQAHVFCSLIGIFFIVRFTQRGVTLISGFALSFIRWPTSRNISTKMFV